MCYSAQVVQDYKKYIRAYGAILSIKEFFDLFWRRKNGAKVKVPKGMELAFLQGETEAEREIATLIDEFNTTEATRIEQDLFAQRKRLADAERALAAKPTKKAAEDKRIATAKIDAAVRRLADLRRTEPLPRDDRIFPGQFAPVIVMEDGQRVLKPMRYQCRPAGKPAAYDIKYPGTYNARRDNLRGFWKGQFGMSHGVMVVSTFFENVQQLDDTGTARNVVLQFTPNTRQEMLVACLWSRWEGGPDEPDLLSFAAVTDEPPAEVAAAGHDRCIVALKPENVDAWLKAGPNDLDALDAMLADPAALFYEHRLAA
jgi:putative SOS response-associated peptidase YedK